MYARENDLLDWAWIVDETREVERTHSWEDPEDYIEASFRHYRKDYWRDQPARIECGLEKGTISGTLAPVLDKYGGIPRDSRLRVGPTVA